MMNLLNPLGFEFVALVILLPIAFSMPQLGNTWFRRAEALLGKIARRRKLSIALIGVLAFSSSSAVSLLVQMPEPRIHDEFSYLLAADTFAHGRLTNPTHPMWVHFESFHIIHQPTYVSKYPPAQGLMLAAGQVICGHAVVGVWMSMGLACAAICWMLQAWVTPSWALLGGVLATVRLGFLGHNLPAAAYGYWSQSYWGGAVTAFGGALLFGALRRVVSRPHIRYTVLMGLGLIVLANSRPYEGLLASLPAMAVIVIWMLGKKAPPLKLLIRNVALPMLLLLTLAAGAMGFYNYRVTGNIFRMPYQVHEEIYGGTPLFLWQPAKPEPAYHHEIMRDFHVGWSNEIFSAERHKGLGVRFQERIRMLWEFYVGFLLIVPLVEVLPWIIIRDQWLRFALVPIGTLSLGLVLSTGASPHYAAPIAALVFVFIVEGMRHLRLWRWRGKQTGVLMVRALTIMSFVSIVVPIAQNIRNIPNLWSLQRANILAQLEKDQEQHLVIVRYDTRHSCHNEWVYNEANIDKAKVVWAREMDEAQNLRLIHYFKDRRAWLLEADKISPTLVPFPMGQGRHALSKATRLEPPTTSRVIADRN